MGTENKLFVVTNIDVKNVTWARSYLDSASRAGIEIVDPLSYKPGSHIYIGDNIPPVNRFTGDKNYYFLAASSLPPSDSPTADDVEIELNNIQRTDATLLVSNAEKQKINRVYPEVSGKLVVNGFPVDIDRIMRHRSEKVPKTVCFLGQSREIKNPDFEIELVQELVRSGFECFHSSPSTLTRRKDLEKVGCYTYENIRGRRYFKLVSSCQYYISTSKYESLGVSGIEASLLGCVAITPRNTGQADWCPPAQTYENYDSKEVVDIVRSRPVPEVNPKLDWYHPIQYFKRVRSLTSIKND